MNTLKMKVLLILSNRYLFRAIGKSVLVWFFTSVLGCLFLYALGFHFLKHPEEFLLSLTLCLIFSSPAIAIAAWVLYKLAVIKLISRRILFSLSAILVTSGLIILLVARSFGFEYIEVVWVLYPFTFAAIISFFFIARKQFLPLLPTRN